MRKLLTGSYAALLVLLVAAPAVASRAAPPGYQSSEPSDGAAVHEAPDRVEVTFDQPLDDASNLTITDECDRRVDDGATEVFGNSMSVALKQKPSGEYRVAYVARGIGGLTGTNEGRFTFIAHTGKSCGDSGGEPHHGNNDGKEGNHGGNHGTKDGSGHSGESPFGTDHSSTDQSGTVHSVASGQVESHSSAAGSSHDDLSGTGDGSNDPSNGNHTTAAAEDFDGITSSDTSRNLLTRANSTTLLISLFLCAALGILGGAVLRATNAR